MKKTIIGFISTIYQMRTEHMYAFENHKTMIEGQTSLSEATPKEGNKHKRVLEANQAENKHIQAQCGQLEITIKELEKFFEECFSIQKIC